MAVAFLFSMGVFRGALAQELKTRIQDYIICIEVCICNNIDFETMCIPRYYKFIYMYILTAGIEESRVSFIRLTWPKG